MNQSGQTPKGVVNIAASESRSNTAYGTLTTPDQVTNIVLPASGLITVLFQATWQESVQGAARAAIFIGSNQLKNATLGLAAPAVQEASIGSLLTAGTNVPLATFWRGLASGIPGSNPNTGYSGDVTTGQSVGGGLLSTAAGSAVQVGGPCTIFAAAGSYTISFQYRATSGSVTASNRKLWVEAKSFA